MKLLVSVFLVSAIAGGQMQLPPGTSSSVPDTQSTAAPSAQSVALQRAEDAIATEKYQAAVTLLTPLAIADQKDARVFYDLGFAQDALGQDEAATVAYRAAVTRNPSDVTARVSLGLLLARTGDRVAGEEQLAAAVKLPATTPEITARAYRALAQMHVESKPAQAADELVAALKLSSETPDDAALAAAIADGQKDDAAAETAYKHAQAMAATDPEVALGYARLLSRKKKHAEAEAVLEPARRAHPDNRALTAEYASQELLLNHTTEVLPLLLQLHNAQPADEAMTRLLATAYIANGDAGKAEVLYTALLKSQPNDAGLQVEWADCLIRQKRSAEAEVILKSIVFGKGKDLPKDLQANAAGMLAFAASTNHDPETVLSSLSARETLLSPSAAYTFLAATAHDTLHHTKQAAEQYRLFLQQAGGSFPDQEWQAKQRLQILDRSK
ncbi:MAG: tetratricopeptide repeat protein [Janthinobacterium lividum]